MNGQTRQCLPYTSFSSSVFIISYITYAFSFLIESSPLHPPISVFHYVYCRLCYRYYRCATSYLPIRYFWHLHHHNHHHHHHPRIKIQRHTLEPIGVDALSFLLSLATHIRCLVDPKILSAINIHNSLSSVAVDSVYPYDLTFHLLMLLLISVTSCESLN